MGDGAEAVACAGVPVAPRSFDAPSCATVSTVAGCRDGVASRHENFVLEIDVSVGVPRLFSGMLVLAGTEGSMGNMARGIGTRPEGHSGVSDK